MTAPGQAAGGVLGVALARVVRGYQLAVSPLMAPHCRYWPSCSEYAIEALRGHGVLRGGWLATRRLCRCHPWSSGGVDLVPAAASGGADPDGPSLKADDPSAAGPNAAGRNAAGRNAGGPSAGHVSLIESSRSPDILGAPGSRSSYARRAAPPARSPIPD